MIKNLPKAFEENMEALGPFDTCPHLAIALSGGIDSLALTFLAEKWVKDRKGRLTLFHVDHSLRPTSADEAYTLTQWMAARGHKVHTLKWHFDKKPQTKIQEQAREARYALLDAACQAHGIHHLLTGHHKEDDIETFLMRQEKKSSDYGLAGMSALIHLEHTQLLRPLLSFSKNALKSIVGTHPFIDDPSNQNTLFKRARLRQTPTPEVSLETFKDKRRKSEKNVMRFLARHLTLSPYGYATLSLFDTATPLTGQEKQLALSFIIRLIGNNDYLPSFKDTQKIISGEGTISMGRTVIHQHKQLFWIVPDMRTLKQETHPQGQYRIWERFCVKTNTKITLAPLGQNGWHQIKNSVETSIPFFALQTFPAAWDKNIVTNVPFLGYSTKENQLQIQYKPEKSILAEFFV